jgi:hypothetical protein
MDDNEYFALGHLDGIEVGVQPTLDGQDIWIEHSNTGRRLTCVLAMGQTDIVRREGAYFWRIAYSRPVDDLMVELIDFLISIRYALPKLVQLELALDEVEGMIPGFNRTPQTKPPPMHKVSLWSNPQAQLFDSCWKATENLANAEPLPTLA